MVIEVSAPAKVNLQLAILGKRNDGFHELASLFQTVSLFDRIEIEITNNKDSFEIIGCQEIPNEENTMGKAVSYFREITAWNQGVEIRVEKNIPIGAGLGGGSSDAAAVLRALDILIPGSRSPRKLMEIGARIGSDVPFFLCCSAAIVKGRGDIVTPIAPRTDYSLVIVYPGFSVSTARAFNWVDNGPFPDQNHPLTSIESIYCESAVADWGFRNDFTEILFAKFPELEGISKCVLDAGAVSCGVTGSGSALAALCDDPSLAEILAPRVSRHLSTPNARIWVAHPLETLPEPVLK